MKMFPIAVSAAAAVIASGVMQPAASIADPIFYDFTATAAGGPLNGDVFAGNFIVDSSEVAAGSGTVSDLTFDILGTLVTQSEGVFDEVPFATFAPDGSLTELANFVIISTARADIGGFTGGIPLPSPVTSFDFDGSPGGGFNYGIDPTQGELFRGGTFRGGPVAAPSVPEPSTWAMMLLGFAGLGYAGYRKVKQTAVANACFCAGSAPPRG
jgi:hypothetical protein